MEKDASKQKYSTGQIFGMIGIVIFLSPIIFRGFLLFFGIPIFLLDLIKCSSFLKSDISLTLWPINVGATLYVTIWISAKMWPKRKNL